MAETNLSFWDRLFREVSHSAWEDWLVKLVAAIVVGLLATGTLWLWRKVAPRLTAIWDGKRRLERGLAAVSAESKGLWLADVMPPKPPATYHQAFRVSKPIIVVANLKGGVGKTTIAANLMAHYANKKGLSVLGIDLDFQGSLSANCLPAADRNNLLLTESDGGLSKAARLIDDRDAEWMLAAANAVDDVPTAKIIPTYYSLAAVENRVMIEWLLGKRSDDIRYHLAKILHDPRVQNAYDRIIIDAPPRLTTGCIEALCAATHVVIPTVLDELSTEAVGAFADQLRIHQKLWPNLRIAGVVGTMINKSPVRDGTAVESPLSDVEVDAQAAGRASLAAALQTAAAPLRDASFFPVECFVPDKVELGRAAGHRIAYASQSKAAPQEQVRAIFDRLGDEIDRRCLANGPIVVSSRFGG